MSRYFESVLSQQTTYVFKHIVDSTFHDSFSEVKMMMLPVFVTAKKPYEPNTVGYTATISVVEVFR